MNNDHGDRLRQLEDEVAAMRQTTTNALSVVAEALRRLEQQLVTQELIIADAAGHPAVIIRTGEDGQPGLYLQSGGQVVAALSADAEGGVFLVGGPDGVLRAGMRSHRGNGVLATYSGAGELVAFGLGDRTTDRPAL